MKGAFREMGRGLEKEAATPSCRVEEGRVDKSIPWINGFKEDTSNESRPEGRLSFNSGAFVDEVSAGSSRKDAIAAIINPGTRRLI
jgi:hypothetical protein